MKQAYKKIKKFVFKNKAELSILFLLTLFVMTFYTLSEAYNNFKLTRSFQFELIQIGKIFVLGIISIAASVWYLLKNIKLREEIREHKPSKLPHLISFVKNTGVVLIASVAFYVYLVNQPSAFGLPPIDMGPFWNDKLIQISHPMIFLLMRVCCLIHDIYLAMP